MDADAFAAPVQGLLVSFEKEIDPRGALNGSASVFYTAYSIARNIHDRSKRIKARIGGNRSFFGLHAGSGDPHPLRLSFKRAG